tara:strand:- start:548 stop:763 length:216 start_codon:yes stop_codon:yes gene_type:complete
LTFTTSNTKSFIHAEQYGKKTKTLKKQVAKLLSTKKATQIKSFKSLDNKPQVSSFKTTKTSKLKTKKRRRA